MTLAQTLLIDDAIPLHAVLFDLDGVLTDTSEQHYRAWQRLADEEGLPFDRAVNERLRGVSRRASLEIIVGERSLPDAEFEALMARKNDYYVASLATLRPSDLLPGALDLLRELRSARVCVGLGSASRNASLVLERLEITSLFDAVVDSSAVEQGKPAPDLFLALADQLGVAPAFCAVIEDAAAGIDAALAAGMWAVGLGPIARIGHAQVIFPSLDGVTLDSLRTALHDAAWTIYRAGFAPAELNHRETVFTTGNGYVAVRGAFEERVAGERPASFIHRLWDDMPISFTELANLPRWYGIELWVDGIAFGIDKGLLIHHRRTLDMRTGVVARTVRWRPNSEGPVVDLRFERLCSMHRPQVTVVALTVELVEGEAVNLRVRSGLDMHVENTGLLHWNLVSQAQSSEVSQLVVRTRGTGLTLGMTARFNTVGTVEWRSATSDAYGQPAAERIATLQRPGARLGIEKFVGMVTGYMDDDPASASARAADDAHAEGYAALRADNEASWQHLWQAADVVIEGDIEAQIAQRFSTFHLLIAAPAHTQHASIGAKTLSGFGYRHHVFWDTELFILPLFSFALPDLARALLMYRYNNLGAARARAAANGYAGAQFPWESAGDGREVTPPWVPDARDPTKLVRIWTGDIEIHITADIAYAVLQYWAVTGDDAWMRDYGAELVLDGARFWASAAKLEADGHYHYRDVIGPDENHDHVDDNAFTNRMAQHHILEALRILEWLGVAHPIRHDELVEALGLGAVQLAHWRAVAAQMDTGAVTADGVIEQFGGYFSLPAPDFAALRDPRRTSSMQALLGIEGAAATQIIKQPDVLMLQHLLSTHFTQAEVAANYAYYDPRTDHEHGSSLGPSVSAIMACRVGDVEAAYTHYMRAAMADLEDVRHNAGDGIHAANAGGMWQAAVLGFAGLHWQDEAIEARPQLPAHWTRLAFHVRVRGIQQRVEVRRDAAQAVEVVVAAVSR